MKDKVISYFEIDKLNSTIGREVLAGFTTFISMAYILFVIPSVLGAAHMDKGAAFTATALASAFGCLMMGIYAKYPIALGPGLGVNGFFAYSVVIGMGIPWQTALAGVFVAGLIFILITVFKLREMIIDAIPQDLKYAISSGIGFFISFIGLKDSKLIIANDSTLVGLGSIHGQTWLTIIGLLIIIVLMLLRVPGAIFISIVATAIIGMLLGMIDVPHAIISEAPSLKPTFGVALSHITDINTMQLFVVVITFLLVTFFDTAGTLVALAAQAGLMKDNKLPRAGRALLSDSVAMIVGALFGTSPLGTYVESSAGIAVGGRTGFASVVTGILFIIGIFFSPLLAVVSTYVTAPALIIVGVLMAGNTAKIAWDKLEIAIPAFVILITMPLTYSIADGIALGIILYPITMITAGRIKEVPKLMYALFVVFLIFLSITQA